ncbi:hypothetical protein GC197_16535 [bacterium]|nr:hypothetical protein [bacterium]
MTVFYIVIAVLVLLFGIFSYLNAANWNVLHVMGLFLTFGAAFAYLVVASAVLKTETSWKKLAEQREKELLAAQQKVEELKYGRWIDPETGRLKTAEKLTDSLAGAKAELKRIMYDRGRVWRNVQHGPPNNNNQISLVLPAVQPPVAAAGGAAPATPTQRNLVPDDIVYVFGQIDNPNNISNDPPFLIPGYFVGEYVVRTIQGNNLTIEPTTKIDVAQQNVINLQNSWVLYDKMPVDDNLIYSEMIEDGQLDLSLRTAAQWIGLGQAQQDQLLAELKRTGQQAGPDDPEVAVMSKVTFQQDYEIPVDAQGNSTSITQDFEPGSGLATAEYLKQGSPTKFKKGDQILMYTTRTPGKTLVDQGIVTVEQQVYVRPLIDFAYQFHTFKREVEDLRDTKYTIEQDIKMLTEADTITKDVVAYREQEKAKLQVDKQKVVYEEEQIAEYKQKLMDYLTETLKENSRLYRTNQTLVEELKRASDAVLRKLGQEKLDKADPNSLTLSP